jgi:hypothetical protein
VDHDGEFHMAMFITMARLIIMAMVKRGAPNVNPLPDLIMQRIHPQSFHDPAAGTSSEPSRKPCSHRLQAPGLSKTNFTDEYVDLYFVSKT